MENILSLLDELEEILDESSTLPFTDKVVVNKQLVYEIITDVRLKLPNEIKQSKWVVEERNKILMDAKKEADTIRRDSQEQIEKLVSEHEISKRAYEQAQKIIETAKITAKEMRLGTLEYADNILMNMEKNLRETMDKFHHQCIQIQDSYTHIIDTVHKNRQEIRGNNE